MWTGLGGPFIRDREPAIWAHPVAFSGSDLALTAPEIMASSRHPSDRSSEKGLVQRPFLVNGLGFSPTARISRESWHFLKVRDLPGALESETS